MFPVLVDLESIKLILIGSGVATVRRLKLLDNDGAKNVKVFSPNPAEELKKAAGKRLAQRWPEEKDFEGASLVMIADLPHEEAGKFAKMARGLRILVNVEDNREFCDYHVPAIVRRGDLLLTASTNGRSPRLARKIRQVLENLFPEIWEEKVREIGLLRKSWKEKGLGMEEVAKKTDEWLDSHKLLNKIYEK